MLNQSQGIIGMTAIRECVVCGIRAYTEYDLQYFQKRKEGKYGRSNMCKCCANKKGRTTGRASKEKYQIKKRYNKSREDYYEKMSMYSECQICGSTKELCYDHCHDIDEFRGVLCRACNRSIGQLGDNAESLLRAYNYLKTFEESK
mgnify:CR=1 FL=1